MLSRRRFLAVTPLLALGGCSRKAAGEPLLAGHVGPLSGSDRAAGEHFQRGLDVALKEVNEDDGVAGRRLAVLHADTRSQGERARQEAVRLVSINKLNALLGGHNQAAADRLAQALQPYPVPLLTPAPHGAAGENVFSLDVSAEFRGQCLARFGAEHFKVRKAVVLVDDATPVCTAVAAAFTRQWQSTGGTVQTWDARAEESAKELPQRLTRAGAELVLFAGNAADLLAVRDAFPAKLPLLFGGEPAEWQRLESGIEGRNVYGATVHAPGKFDEDGKAFLKSYRDRYNEEASASACQGYELTRLLSLILGRVKGAGPARVHEELARKDEDFPTLTGTLSFHKGHARRPLFVVRPRQAEPEHLFPAETS